MNRNFLLVVALLISMASVYGVPTLTSVNISPNPAYTGDLLTITSIGLDDIDNTKIDANYDPPAGYFGENVARDDNWMCQSFKTLDEGGGTFYQAYIGTFARPEDIINEGRIYAYTDSTHVGEILSVGTEYSNKGGLDASCNWKTFNDWSAFEMSPNTNYWLCFEMKAPDPTDTPNICTDTTPAYSDGVYATGGVGTNKGMPEPDPEVAMGLTSGQDVLFRIYFSQTGDVRLRSSIETAPAHDVDDFVVSDFFTSDPYVSVTNVYSSTKTVKTVLQSEDDNALSNEIETTLTILRPVSDFMTCDPISNISSCVVDRNQVNVVLSNKSLDFEFSLTTTTSAGQEVPIVIENTLNNSKQYFVYSSDSGSDYFFNDTITYGSSVTNGVQKIWKAPEGETPYFEHSFTDSFLSNSTNYFKLYLRQPMKTWSSVLNNAEWDVSLLPNLTDLNEHFYDQFQASSYSNVRNELIQSIPNISGSFSNSTNYIFQFNAKVDSGLGTILAGTVGSKGSNPIDSATVTIEETRFSFAEINDGILSQATNETTSRLYQISDYALLQRGFFTKDFEVKHTDGSELDVYVDDSNLVKKFIQEGRDLHITGRLYDRANTIDFIEITAFLELDNDNNRVLYFKEDVPTAEESFINYAFNLDGIVDFTADQPNFRDVLIKVKVTDVDSNYSEVQSDWFKLRKFPYLPDDIRVNGTVINQLVGLHPEGSVQLTSIAPETIRGVRLRFYDSTTELPDSDFNVFLYKDQDFTCRGRDCSFNFKINDWIFPKYDLWRFTTSVLLTTQDEDLNNSMTTDTDFFYVNFKQFEIAKILQARERPADYVYKPTERIPLVVVLKDSGATNLNNEVQVILQISDCNTNSLGLGVQGQAASGCTVQDINYSATSFIFDDTAGLNYWFFEHVFVKDNFTVFDDANFMRVIARIIDKKNRFADSTTVPILTSKCQTRRTDCSDFTQPCFWENALTSIIEFGTGCTVPSGDLVLMDDSNNTQEIRIDFDSTIGLTTPNLECFGCVNTDNNNLYRNNLEQQILCGGWYTLGQANIDKFNFWVSNEFSDFSEDRDQFKQYIHTSIPSATILFNDPLILKQSLEQQFTAGKCSLIETVGEGLLCGMNTIFKGVANPISEILIDGTTAAGFTPNVGLECDFDNAMNPNFVSGFIFIETKGIDVTNMDDFKIFDDVAGSDPKHFFETMSLINRPQALPETEITFFASGMIPVKKVTVTSGLVIDEEFSDLQILTGNTDADVDFQTLPSILKFNVILDLVFNDERSIVRRYVPISITTTGQFFSSADILQRQIEKGINDFISDPIGVILGGLSGTILSIPWWAGGGFILVFFLAIALLYTSIVYRKFKGEGG